MRFPLSALVLGSLLTLTGTTAVHAAPKSDKPAALLRKPAAAGLGGATGDARIVAIIGQSGAVIRSKGVAGVSRVGFGAYCVIPKDKSVNLDTVVPSVSVDFSGSNLSDSVAQFSSTRFLCPAGTLEVRTLARTGGPGASLLFSDGVQFSLVVP